MVSHRELANAVRMLTVDAINISQSGHPGAPMGMADFAEVLFNEFMRHNPSNPQWPNRDRFVLSNGHASMMLYAILHLCGYDLSIEDLKNFRQLGSKTPGHPEYRHTPGIETTTGPLGQGVANAVGMALAEHIMAAQFNKEGHTIVDHYTYVTLGDGCMMEGISHEACSFAGALGLKKLIAFYDNNDISIDGNVDGWFNDDTAKRFEAYGWHVVRNVDGHDPEDIRRAIVAARASDKPSLICCHTVIGKGSPSREGSHNIHGTPLGEKEVAATRINMDWNYAPFVIPDKIYTGWDAREAGARAEAEWKEKFEAYRAAYPAEAEEFLRRTAEELPANFAEEADRFIASVNEKAQSLATRVASKESLNGFAALLPEFLGGSADLTPSNDTFNKASVRINDNYGAVTPNFAGNYLSYGVREFAMSAMMNGVKVHGGLMPYGATFLTFSDYARNALRMAALMKIGTIFVFTHDSIGVGEDGPTHHPIEQVPTLRMIPDISVWRPCDTVETAVAWRAAIESKNRPTALGLTRQALAFQPRSDDTIANISKGGYILKDTDGMPDVILIGTGSEVELAVQSAAASNRKVRVVSMPCVETFEAQDDAYKESVLPKAVTARIAIEAAQMDGWWKYVGFDGAVIGMTTFGASAPADQLFEHFDFTVDNVVKTIDSLF